MNTDSKFDPIVPIGYNLKHESELIKAIREVNQRSGIKRFLPIWPTLNICAVNKGLPSIEEYREFGASLLRMKQALGSDGIDVGWYVRCNIAAYSRKFQNIIGINGEISDVSCPMDARCRRNLGDRLAAAAGIANPFLILLEEDAVAVSHAVSSRLACFCPLHLKEFARRAGKRYEIEELAEIFAKGDEECVSLRKILAELNRDVLVRLATDVRAAVDQVAPKVRIGICQVGTTQIDGDCIESVAQAYAGRTQPLVRLCGAAGYTEDYARHLAGGTFNAMYYCQHLPKDFELIHETDPCPHTRFYASAAKVESLMGLIISYGFDQSLFWCLRYIPGDVQQEHAYYDMFTREHRRFNALKAAVRDCELDGCEILGTQLKQVFSTYDRSRNVQSSEIFNAWYEPLTRFSIPCTTKNGKVKAVSGDYIKTLNDEQAVDLLKSRVLMDGKAAFLLAQRGFAKYIGAEVKVLHGYPDVAYEVITAEEILARVTGRLIASRLAHDGKGILYELEPAQTARMLLRCQGHDGSMNLPLVQCYENSIGGRIAIMATDMDKNMRGLRVINLICPRRKEVFRYALEWLGESPLPCVVRDIPNVLCVFNRSVTSRRAVITLINTLADDFYSFTLDLALEWQGSKVGMLAEDGEWRELRHVWAGSALTIEETLRLMRPIYLELRRD